MALIDVAVPCYQYGHFLRDCVGSIVSQNVPGLRVHIIDNASTDDSLDVARQLAQADARISISAHDKNLGPNASYNEAVDWAQSKYFLLIDADDMLVPGALARAVEILEARPDVAFAHGVEARLNPGGRLSIDAHAQASEVWSVTSGAAFIDGLLGMPVNRIGAPTVVRRTQAQKQAGYYRPELPFTDDLEMWLRLARLGAVAETQHTQAVRRIHPGQMTAHYKSAQVQVRDFIEREAAFASFLKHDHAGLDATAEMARVRRGLAAHAYWSAISHACRGYPATGWELMKYTARRRPAALALPPLSWPFKMKRPLGRIGDIMREALSDRRA